MKIKIQCNVGSSNRYSVHMITKKAEQLCKTYTNNIESNKLGILDIISFFGGCEFVKVKYLY